MVLIMIYSLTSLLPSSSAPRHICCTSFTALLQRCVGTKVITDEKGKLWRDLRWVYLGIRTEACLQRSILWVCCEPALAVVSRTIYCSKGGGGVPATTLNFRLVSAVISMGCQHTGQRRKEITASLLILGECWGSFSKRQNSSSFCVFPHTNRKINKSEFCRKIFDFNWSKPKRGKSVPLFLLWHSFGSHFTTKMNIWKAAKSGKLDWIEAHVSVKSLARHFCKTNIPFPPPPPGDLIMICLGFNRWRKKATLCSMLLTRKARPLWQLPSRSSKTKSCYI